MRSFSEEKKQGTLELLLTKPITDLELIFGKYLSALALICITLSSTILYYVVIVFLGPIPFGPFFTSLIGFVLMSAFFIGIGIFVSSLTENQIVAFIISVLIALFFFLIRNNRLSPECYFQGCNRFTGSALLFLDDIFDDIPNQGIA